MRLNTFIAALMIAVSISSASAAEDTWLIVYGNRISSVFVQRPLTKAERYKIARTGTAGLREVIRGWQAEEGLAVAARVYVQLLLGLSGSSGGVNGEMAGNLAERIVRENEPWSNLITADTCVADDGSDIICDSGAPYRAGILTLRSFMKGNAGRFNLHRANVMLKAFSCRAFPINSDLEPRIKMNLLIDMFAKTGEEAGQVEEFGNGNKCYSCHGQFAWHTQLFVKFDAQGLYQATATGLQAGGKQAGESSDGTFTSHMRDPASAASEVSQYFGRKVDNLAEAAAVIAASSTFVECSFENLLNFGLGLGGTQSEKAHPDLTLALSAALKAKTSAPTFSDLVTELFSNPLVIDAALGKKGQP